MTHITTKMLQTIGININDEESDSLVEHLNQTIEEHIGLEITDSLEDEQLLELAALHETATDDEIREWLELNVPDFKDIVSDTVDIAIGELAENRLVLSAA